METRQPLDTASAVLAAAREDKNAEAAEVRQFQAAVEWAAMHSVDSLGPAAVWEGEVPIAGEGAPLVAEFCIAEFALAIGKSTDGGRQYLGEAMEVRYRLPKTWALVTAGKLPVWRARQIAKTTLSLPKDGALFVDTHVAPTAARLSYAQLERVVEEARVRFDPAEAEERRLAAADARCFDVNTRQVSFDGTVDVHGTLDLADALDLDDAITTRAQELKDLGCDESLDVRRSMAAGDLARNQGSLEFPTHPSGPDDRAHRRRPLRESGEHPVVPLHGPGPRLVPVRVRARASGHRPQRTPLEPRPRPHPAAARAGAADSSDVRVPRVQQTVAHLRLRPHHRPHRRRTYLLLQPRATVSVPPPTQDPRRLVLRTHRSGVFVWTSPLGHVYVNDLSHQRHT